MHLEDTRPDLEICRVMENIHSFHNAFAMKTRLVFMLHLPAGVTTGTASAANSDDGPI